jgi:hypothetical protein
MRAYSRIEKRDHRPPQVGRQGGPRRHRLLLDHGERSPGERVPDLLAAQPEGAVVVDRVEPDFRGRLRLGGFEGAQQHRGVGLGHRHHQAGGGGPAGRAQRAAQVVVLQDVVELVDVGRFGRVEQDRVGTVGDRHRSPPGPARGSLHL